MKVADEPSAADGPSAAAVGPSDASVLSLQRTIEAPPERVFAAWTRPEAVRRWLSPGALEVSVAELDVRVGGSYRIVMVNQEGETHSPTGVYEEVTPNERLVFTWSWEGSDLVTRVRVTLRALGEDRTEVTLVHEGFPDAESRAAHEEGWSGCLEKLPGAVAQPAPKTLGDAS